MGAGSKLSLADLGVLLLHCKAGKERLHGMHGMEWMERMDGIPGLKLVVAARYSRR
jgi:hypothetical protein